LPARYNYQTEQAVQTSGESKGLHNKQPMCRPIFNNDDGYDGDDDTESNQPFDNIQLTHYASSVASGGYAQ
jgi:hypothetical protein